MCNNDPGKNILEAKARLAALFGDLKTYMEFMMKRQERRKIRGFTDCSGKETGET